MAGTPTRHPRNEHRPCVGRLGIVTLAVALVLAACGGGVDGDANAAGEAAGSELAEQGLEIFRRVGCSACHGQNGEGGVGPPLAGHTEEQVFRQVRTPKGDVMPPFPPEKLSDDEVRAIAAWIATLGEEMVMAHPPEEGADHGEAPMSRTEVAHLRLMIAALDAENPDDARRHIEHLGLHGGSPELESLAAQLGDDLDRGDLHGAEQRAVEALGPAATDHFDPVAAHLGMALAANDRGEPDDVEYHLTEAARAAEGHDHAARIQAMLDTWRADTDRHSVIDSLYAELGLEHPPH